MKQKYNYELIPDVDAQHGELTATPGGGSRRTISATVFCMMFSVVAVCLWWVIENSYADLALERTPGSSLKHLASIVPDPLRVASRSAVEKILKDLADQIEGEVVWYDKSNPKSDVLEAAGVWNLNAGVPMASIVPATEHDVQLVIPVLQKLDAQHRVPFRIKSGGHNYAGFCSVPNGILLSLERLTALDFDVVSGVATLGPAVTVEQLLDQVLEPFHYAGVMGSCPGVAIGGFALSGGFGMLSRKYGLGVDSVLSLRAVVANGTLVTASADTDPDLFWALRGAGGGSFAVVTSVQYQLHPAWDEVLFGSGQVKVQEMPATMVELGRRSGTLPGEITFWVEGMIDKHGKTDFTFAYVGASLGELDTGESLFRNEIKALLPDKTAMELDRASWAETTREGGNFEGNLVRYWNGYLYSKNNTEKVWEYILEQMVSLCQDHYPYIMVDIELWGGKVAKVSVNETAFGHRTPVYNVGIGLLVPVDEKNALRKFGDMTKTTDKVWSKISQYLVGSYTNYQMESLAKDEYARAYWGNNLERLEHVKAKFDPLNTFRHEQSVPIP